MKQHLLIGLGTLAAVAVALILLRPSQEVMVPQAPGQEDSRPQGTAVPGSGVVRHSLADAIPQTGEGQGEENQAEPKDALDGVEDHHEGDQFVQKLLLEGTGKGEWQTGDLQALAVDEAFSPEERSSALAELLNRIQSDDMPRNEKLNYLTAVKDSFAGEDRQSIMNTLATLQDIGGGDAIIDSYLRLPDNETRAMEGVRMLTYLRPDAALSSASVDAMISRYGEEQSPELQRGLSQAIATAGGDKGMSWFLGQVTASKDFMSWTDMVTTLGGSASPLAYNYLHKLINSLARDENYEPHKELIRSAVTQLEATLEDKGRLPSPR